MSSNRYKISALERPFWLGMAMFFIIFASCPVRKYFRLQLYKLKPMTESSAAAQHINLKDGKDCSIAEKNELSHTIVYSVVQNLLGTDADFSPFFFSALLSLTALLFIRRNEQSLVLFKPPAPPPVVIPLYLQVRHLQI